MKIQSVAILGAGAVGCYVLCGLADKAAANSLQLGVVAEGCLLYTSDAADE